MPKESMKSYDHIFSELFSTPWLITEDAMVNIIEIAQNHIDPKSVAAKAGFKVADTRRAVVYGDTGVIPISGPIFPKSNLMTDFSGATSVEMMAKDLSAVMGNDDISEIILDIDSPGGHVTGIHEMANMIREYSQDKKITAYVSGTGASAAYWLGSAASEMVVDKTSRIGSIGVVTVFPKGSGDTIEIVNSASPNKRVDVNTDEGKKVVVEQMDALADVFIDSVAEFRNVSTDTVRKEFGKGGIKVGAHAVKAGMADRLGSFEQLLKENGGTSMPGKGEQKATLTLETFKADHADLHEEIRKSGADEAASSNAQVIADKDKTIAKLESDLETQKEANSTMNDRVKSLEKKDALRDEQDMAGRAETIVTTKLSASALPARTHSKVRKQLNHDEFISEGKFDSVGFSDAVDAEISDWEDTIAESSGGPVQGFSPANEDKEDTDAAKGDEDIANELIGLAGGTVQ